MKTNTLPNYLLESKEINIIGPCAIEEGLIDLTLPSLIIDGGLNHGLSFERSFSVGDGDSSDTSLDITLPRDKDQSDLAYALNLLGENIKCINLYGFLGGRRDHEFINIGEVYNFCERFEAIARFQREIYLLPKGAHCLEIIGEFSIMSLRQSLISIGGQAKYCLEESSPLGPLSSHGLSNIGKGEITLSSNTPLIIYTQEQSLILL
ncbi:hypothetical protein [Halobacteriovorax sp. JY17]|uniref:hypothetical protein n=1 Tax=Halobacteriovorax sp. JY17 TaxID=2014617 RepID=UPI000C485EBF|nr:hypothetical protein [Halobacteriovorax sp. JY17]PIK16007.1 MAG: hypothetical protein CES88_04570 [Halobacteriovorax sp. JY17]